MRKIGFIGVGIMGKSMVRNLKKKGFEVSIYARQKEKVEELLNEGVLWCNSIEECAKQKDIVITIVGFPKDVEEVYFSENGILNYADKGTYLIDMTTTSPKLAIRLDKEAKKRGLFALDAPVTGGDIGAKNGTLAILVGGEKEDFLACKSVFEAMGNNIVYEGLAGFGQHTKMANQIAIAGAIAGVSEAIVYARKVGLDTEKMFQSISTGAASSMQLTNLGPKMLKGDFQPGFFIKHFIKDMKIAAEEAKEAGISLEILNQVLDMYQSLEAEGKDELGTQAFIQYYDK